MGRSGLIFAAITIAVLVMAGLMARRVPAFVTADTEIARATPLAADNHSVTIRVPAGANSDAIAKQMEGARIIRDASLFAVVAGLMDVQNELAAGEYEFMPGLPVVEAIQRLRGGITVPQVRVTIPEGKRLDEVGALLEQQGLFSAADFQAALAAGDFTQPVLGSRPAGASLEGYLFPDTYFFSKKATPRQVIDRMVGTFEERFAAEFQRAADAQGLTVHQMITLASIVEREAQAADERPLIAAVFLNRMKQGMPLQADPTVQYALTIDPASVAKYGWWKRDLTTDDLKIKSPYNTYTNVGLPPGPIANPGLAVLQAVASPAPVKSLYFVAKGDGTHAFADTLDEHNRNVAKYQR